MEKRVTKIWEQFKRDLPAIIAGVLIALDIIYFGVWP